MVCNECLLMKARTIVMTATFVIETGGLALARRAFIVLLFAWLSPECNAFAKISMSFIGQLGS
tara:strand:+ start:359 stop:547 length:189 start_codon:yes stop_codon:yes gene_type:complete